MLPRRAISDADRDRIEGPTPGRPGLHGGGAGDDRPFIDAALDVGRAGVPRADPPERPGEPNTARRRWDPIPSTC